MTRRRLVRAAALALATAAGVVALLPSGAGAATPYQVAWWNRLQVTAPAAQVTVVPSPPNVPDGGLYVAGTAASPTAFGALRFASQVAAGGTLELDVPGGGANGAVIDACAITGAWSGGGNQDVATAPTYDCAQKVTGVVDPAGTSITWAIPAALFRPDQYAIDIALLPGGAAASQVAFAPPSDSAFTPSAAAGPTDPAPDAAPADAAPLDAGSLPLGDTAAPALDLGVITPPADVSPGAPSAAPAVTTPVPAKAPGVAGGVALPALPGSVVRPGDGRGERIGAVAGMLLLAAALWWLGGQPARAPRLLGGAALAAGDIADPAPTAVRGIGRFARARSGRAKRL